MTLGVLQATIRQIPGVQSVKRWQRFGQDRLYLQFAVSEPGERVFIDVKTATIFGDTGQWRHDPHELGALALRTVREIVGVYRQERTQELHQVLPVKS